MGADPRRAPQWAAERVGGAQSSVASAARRLGVGWGTVWSWVLDAADCAAADLSLVGPVRQLGLDETVMCKATRLRRRRCVAAAVDAATGRIVDVFDRRDVADVREWPDSRPAQRRRQIETICVDPHTATPRANAKRHETGRRISNDARSRCSVSAR